MTTMKEIISNYFYDLELIKRLLIFVIIFNLIKRCNHTNINIFYVLDKIICVTYRIIICLHNNLLKITIRSNIRCYKITIRSNIWCYKITQLSSFIN